ncbi:hypothetical protein GGR53DRAFT_463277 [Hypoxylon sp. FL1150]|nr:hypothetical protein GGR53DRAFT_463277 [Hypoxylon sp. FL1150]
MLTPSAGSSKQKSCNACVRSKRRCDKRAPTCGNCIKKRHRCVYGGRPLMPSSATTDSADISLITDSLGDSPSALGDGFMLDDGGSTAAFDVDFGLLSRNTMLQIDSSFDSLLNYTFENTYGLNVSSAPTNKTLTIQAYSKMLPMCENFAPWQLSDPSSTAAYAMGVFKSFHVAFSRDNSTIYMHRSLYTPATRGYVLRALHEQAASLVETASGVTLTPRDKLARVHAMMVYQTIRMFDGDITLNQQAEDNVPLLDVWTNELGKIKDNLDDVAEKDVAEIRSKPPESWERWVFAESVRRTFLISAALKAFWDLLKGRRSTTNIGAWGFVHRWTLSRHLWDAADPVEFSKAWKEKPIWIISSFYLEEFLRTGSKDDADEFALVLLTLCFGVNEMKMFNYETSQQLSVHSTMTEKS